jgi:hypothetical protein
MTQRVLGPFLSWGLLVLALLFGLASAHGIDGKDAGFLASNQGVSFSPFVYLGAKHMVTGYDHLLFLLGVIFFLYHLSDVTLYVSLFTLGHSITLLFGVLGDIAVNSYLIDAVIALSIVYKAFDNLQGFQRFFGVQPSTRIAVIVFGLFHGFGLASKLQDFNLSANGLVANILSFNLGVEIGQVLALFLVLILLSFWRSQPSFMRYAFATNTLLMAGGFILMGYQLVGLFSS